MPPKKETKPVVEPVVESVEPVVESVEPVVESVEPVVEVPVEEKVFTVNKIKCVSINYMANPFTRDVFFPGESIEATLDNWLQCQIDAKLVTIC